MIELPLKNAPPVVVEATVRTVPQQRLVARGRWNDLPVYAKKFMGARAKRHFERDVAGVQKLINAHIATPRLLFQGEVQGEPAFVAIYEAIENVLNAEEVLRQLNRTERFVLLKKIVAAVAQQHQAGLIQTDLYLKNFLVKDDTVYSLDGDGIRDLSWFSQKRQRLINLATLFSKMDVLDDDWIPELYEYYCQHLDILYKFNEGVYIWELTQNIRHHVTHGYAEKKVFRNCTDVKVTQAFRYFIAQARQVVIGQQALLSLDDYLNDSDRNIKNGRTCTVAKAMLAGQEVVIKRYNLKSFWHGFNRAFRPSRAAVSWANAHRLQVSNISTPAPIALVEERFGVLRRRAYYVSAYVEAPDIVQFFIQEQDIKVKKQVAYEVALLFYRLHLLRISHGDCKASNIIILDKKPMLLDLDSMRDQPWRFEYQHIKDLKRFMRNWCSDIEATAFFKQAFSLVYDTYDDPWRESLLVRAGIVG